MERAKDQREKLRGELESVKKRLEVFVDVRIIQADLEEAENLCRTIEKKDQEMLLTMLKARDWAKKEWLKNWVNSEVHTLMRRDRDDVKNHIQVYADDLQKLQKIIDKFGELQAKQAEQVRENEEDLKLLQNEMNILTDERRECEKELKIIQSEMARLK